MKNVFITLIATTALASCASDTEIFRKEFADSRAYIERTCGGNQDCREQVAQQEALRVAKLMDDRAERRQRFATAISEAAANYSQRQHELAVAQASRPVVVQPLPPRNVTCHRVGQITNCQSY